MVTTLSSDASSASQSVLSDQLGKCSLDLLVFKKVIVERLPPHSFTSDTELEQLLTSVRAEGISYNTLTQIAAIEERYTADGKGDVRVEMDNQQRDYAALLLIKGYAHYAAAHHYLKSAENGLGHKLKKLGKAKEHFEATLTSLQDAEKRGTQGIHMLKVLTFHQLGQYTDLVATIKDTFFEGELDVLKHVLLAKSYDQLQNAGKRDQHVEQARRQMALYNTTSNMVVQYARNLLGTLSK